MAKHRFHASQIKYFWHELSMLQQQGKSLLSSFEYLSIDPVSQQQDALMLSLFEAYQKNASLADALSAYPQFIDQGTLSLIRLGESQRCLASILSHLAHRKDHFSVMRVLLKALSYPVIVIFTCVLLSLILLIFVMPMFAEMYLSMRQDLPLPTLLFMGIADWLVDFWWLVVSCMFGLVLLFKKNKLVRFQLLLRIPILKTSLQFMTISELLYTMGVVLSQGSKSKESLVVVASTLSNPVYREEWQKAFQGQDDVVACLRQISFFPDAFTRMLSAAKEAHLLHEACPYLAAQAVELANDCLERFNIWSRLFLMITVGVLIGSMVIAIYWPIFQMTSGI
ncbi:MAG: type II secretion system F family protein [Mariprofundaceae bacterium]|nr:type II secretion system F family protein [Mariprofundaceae bacterium]